MTRAPQTIARSATSWLVDEAALSPEAWAKQRVDWLQAQQQWILANAGEIHVRQ